MNRERLSELDALRGLAALTVVCFHFFYRYDTMYGHSDSIPVEWIWWGKLGIELFFLVSGFVIFWTLERTNRPIDFIISRFSRLYPVYWVALIITFTTVAIFGLPGLERSVSEALANLLMFHSYFNVPHVDTAYWTLVIELTFYFWVFVLYCIGRLDWVEPALAGCTLAGVLHHLGYIEVHGALVNLFNLEFMGFFLAGICFFHISRGNGTRLRWLLIAFSFAVAAITYPTSTLPYLASFYVAFYFAVSGRWRWLSLRPLVFLGTISYSLYLIHQNVGYVILNLGYAHNLNPWLSLLIAFVVSLALATALTFLIERPMLNAVRERYQSSNTMQRWADRWRPLGSKVAIPQPTIKPSDSTTPSLKHAEHKIPVEPARREVRKKREPAEA